MSKGTLKRLTSWSRTQVSESVVYEPRSIDEIRRILAFGQILPRGSGMSFGDVGLTDKGNLVDLRNLAKSEHFHFDSKQGTIDCPAGLSQLEILKYTAPNGWVLPSIPGSARITIGGAIAADAHGKNHFSRNSIGHHLTSLVIMLASGEVVEVSRDNMPDLFWATVGGLGLTGIVLRANLNLQRFGSCYAKEEMVGFECIDEMMDIIEKRKDKYEYVLAWTSGDFRPGKRWSGAVSIGNDIASNQISDPWSLPRRRKITLPFQNPIPKGQFLAGWIVNKVIGSKFKAGNETLVDINRFFFPQDMVSNWNLAFGRAGFVEYQCCVPLEISREFLARTHLFLNRNRIFCFLVAIKRLRSPEISGPLTFAQDGISLALDIPVRQGLMELLNQLDEIVVEFGGRINLVKDSRMPSATLKTMYPRFNKWKEIREKYDPHQKFCSNLSKRLGLTQ